MINQVGLLGYGKALPPKIVHNRDLTTLLDTSDEWIEQRTGIQTRRYVDFDQKPQGASDLGALAGEQAIAQAGLTSEAIDCIVYATLSPDKTFPGDGVLVQEKLGIPAGVPCIDVRNQCSGFLYGLGIANAMVKIGMYRHVLLIGSEVQSSGLDFSRRGRDVTALFGDGAGAVVLGPPPAGSTAAILDVTLHADGRFANELQSAYPSSAQANRLNLEPIAQGLHFPKMNGKLVFKHAVQRMPEAILESLANCNCRKEEIDLLITHQANLRISEAVCEKLALPASKMFNNIQRYGNTTAASIPIALCEANEADLLKPNSLLCLAAFGAGFTWGAALIRL